MTTTQNVASTAATGDRTRQNTLQKMDFPPYVLLPGDPNRVDLIASQWQDATVIDLPRGYRAAVGTFEGVRLGTISTGIGAPSLEGVFNDLTLVGAHTFIRVGTTGTLKPDIENGSLIINDASVRLDGSTDLYVRKEYPAAASYEATFALVEAASGCGLPFRVGTGATTGSFLAGQGRAAFGCYVSPAGEQIFEEMKRANVLNFEMETAALFTFARLVGLRAGALCSVIANRMNGSWGDNGSIETACRVGAGALRRIAMWDLKARAGGSAWITAATLAD